MSVSSSNLTKLKTNLSLSIQRLKLLEKKKTELAQKSRKEIADYISQGKAERAKIRVEHIIREDYMVEAMEIVEMYCDTLLARFGMIEQLKTLDEGIEEAVSSLIWVAPRMQSDIKELKVVHDILAMKYGKAYALAVRENQLKTVNEKMMLKMGVQAPPKILVERYLIEIAKSLNVDYEPDADILREDELYRKGGSSSLLDPNIPPPPGPLIDFVGLEHPGSSSSGGGGGGVMPPPLPSQPPSGPYPPSGSQPGANNKGGVASAPAGFVVDVSSAEDLKKAMANGGGNNLHLPPQLPGTQSVPPSYESVVSGGGPNGTSSAPAPGANNIPDFDESALPSVPNLPEIPNSDDEDSPPKKGGGGSKNQNQGGGGGDFDFDDLRRRFDELKKKK